MNQVSGHHGRPRAKADAWMAEKMEEAESLSCAGMKIDQLHIDGLDHESYTARDLTDPAEDSGKVKVKSGKLIISSKNC